VRSPAGWRQRAARPGRPVSPCARPVVAPEPRHRRQAVGSSAVPRVISKVTRITPKVTKTMSQRNAAAEPGPGGRQPMPRTDPAQPLLRAAVPASKEPNLHSAAHLRTDEHEQCPVQHECGELSERPRLQPSARETSRGPTWLSASPLATTANTPEACISSAIRYAVNGVSTLIPFSSNGSRTTCRARVASQAPNRPAPSGAPRSPAAEGSQGGRPSGCRPNHRLSTRREHHATAAQYTEPDRVLTRR
jgi:hypothetical protein